jgi:hypothetical protein
LNNYILGIKGSSLFFKLKGIEFPWSFPIDIMHLYSENIAPLMYLHWSGGFFKNSKYNDNSYNLTKKELEYIGKLMKESQTCIPLEFGRALEIYQNIILVLKLLNGATGLNYLFSVPFLKDIFIDK